MNRGILLLLIVLTLLISLVFVVIALGPGLFIAGGPNLVRNGSFETGRFVPDPVEIIVSGQNFKVLCGGSSALDDWHVFRQPVTGGQNCGSSKDAIAWCQSPSTLAIDAQEGRFFVDLTGFNTRPPQQFGQVQQDVENTEPGALYELSFAIGSSSRFPPPTPKPPNPPQIGIFVKVVGVSNGAMSFDATAPTPDVSHWDLHTMRFRAVDRTTQIMFLGVGNPGTAGVGGDYVGLDNVSLRRVCFIVDAILYGCAR